MNLTLQHILTAASAASATVIHLSCGSPLSIRAAGELRFVEEFGVMSPPQMQELLSELLTPEERSRLAEEKAFLGSKKFSREHRYRIHVLFERGLPAVTLHAFPIRIDAFTTLGLPERAHELLAIEHGFMVVSGPVGGGKTSSVAALCESWNQVTTKRILLIQRPIEYALESKKSHIEHVEVGSDVPTFAQALENVASEDYDVVYVSEYTESGVLERIFSLAAAGTCVILEIQSQTTAHALEQLIAAANHQGVSSPEHRCADHFSGSLNVRLIPALKTPLVLAAGVAFAVPEVRTFIRSKKFDALLHFFETSQRDAVVSLDESLALLVNRNAVSFEHALPFTHNPSRFQRLVNGISLRPSSL